MNINKVNNQTNEVYEIYKEELANGLSVEDISKPSSFFVFKVKKRHSRCRK